LLWSEISQLIRDSSNDLIHWEIEFASDLNFGIWNLFGIWDFCDVVVENILS